mgnify:FL=1
MTRGITGSGLGGFTIKENAKAYHDEYYKTHKERILARTRARYAANPEKYKALSQANYRKKQEKKALEKRESRVAVIEFAHRSAHI